ncbi:MarR family winged helix-turn-helix transcriptional regulator [Paenibacillus alvei]|uniref:DNA-binding transcriptional regulator, MarR family n=1 Tax=Paenibacillus alvei TaxID=44250 RepID=A0A383RF22_PAEAL|nr:MarR family transcriptional regulator [Paenibacillus alvei]SYX85443.1 DNA-binding transcriptional regulator, MarR family [Paenibacillus alvei]
MKRDAKTVIERYIAAEFTVMKHLFNEIGEAIPNHLTIDQYQIMCVLHQRGQCTSTDLAAVFKVVKSSITAIINRLVDHGYVERTPAEEDRRVIELSLTEEGQMVYEQVDKQVQDIVSSYLTHFNETEVETFIGTYEKLARLMTEGKNQT